MFDTIYSFATAIKETENALKLDGGNVSCTDEKPSVKGAQLSTYVEKVSENFLRDYSTI